MAPNLRSTFARPDTALAVRAGFDVPEALALAGTAATTANERDSSNVANDRFIILMKRQEPQRIAHWSDGQDKVVL
jgi:hypothetical protein